jgi:hypothetical protein
MRPWRLALTSILTAAVNSKIAPRLATIAQTNM